MSNEKGLLKDAIRAIIKMRQEEITARESMYQAIHAESINDLDTIRQSFSLKERVERHKIGKIWFDCLKQIEQEMLEEKTLIRLKEEFGPLFTKASGRGDDGFSELSNLSALKKQMTYKRGLLTSINSTADKDKIIRLEGAIAEINKVLGTTERQSFAVTQDDRGTTFSSEAKMSVRDRLNASIKLGNSYSMYARDQLSAEARERFLALKNRSAASTTLTAEAEVFGHLYSMHTSPDGFSTSFTLPLREVDEYFVSEERDSTDTISEFHHSTNTAAGKYPSDLGSSCSPVSVDRSVDTQPPLSLLPAAEAFSACEEKSPVSTAVQEDAPVSPGTYSSSMQRTPVWYRSFLQVNFPRMTPDEVTSSMNEWKERNGYDKMDGTLELTGSQEIPGSDKTMGRVDRIRRQVAAGNGVSDSDSENEDLSTQVQGALDKTTTSDKVSIVDKIRGKVIAAANPVDNTQIAQPQTHTGGAGVGSGGPSRCRRR